MRTGPLKKAVSRLFVDALGWDEGDGCIAESGGARVVASEQAKGDEIAFKELDSARFELSWRKNGTVYKLRIDSRDPSESCLKLLATLKRELVVREGTDHSDEIASAFDISSIATEFLNDYRVLFETNVVDVPIADEEERRSFFGRFLSRVLLLAFLNEKGWLRFKDGDNYLLDLYEDWKADPGPHLFHQRLALVTFNALDEPRDDARRMLRKQIGDVPYIGGGLFTPIMFEQEFPADGAVVPEGLFEDLLGPRGILRRYDFTVSESGPNETVVAVSPEVLGAALSAFASGEDRPSFEDTSSLRLACRREIAAHLGVDEALTVPTSETERKQWSEKLQEIHVFDDPCGSGSYLVAMLEELTGLMQEVSADTDRRVIKRALLENNLSGLDTNAMAVHVARLRLALAVLSDDVMDFPLPLPNLRQVVKKGGSLTQNRQQQNRVEDEKTEFKSTFEWDSRRGARNPDLRFASLKTVAAFLNSQGGTLYIGVDDNGNAIGLKDDLKLIQEDPPQDIFINRFREFLKNNLDPMPLSNVTVRFEQLDSVQVCKVEVKIAASVTYLTYKDKSGQKQEGVFVRDGNRTVELKGRDRDQFVVTKN